MKVVGHATARVDGLALAKGKPVFADDLHLPGPLHLKILRSPTAHARIARIDATAALRLRGVAAVLTHEDFRPHLYTTAGQGYPEPSPRDTRILDERVRFVGDRVAFVAAESIETAERALGLIDVEYEQLPAVFDPEEALRGEVLLHEGKSGDPFLHDPDRNVASRISEEIGDVEQGLLAAKHVFEGRYSTPYVQHVHIEPHVALSWLDENERLVIRTATQVPFHVRRIVAEVLDFPVGRIRVIKPRIGGGFGGKQEIICEEVCAAVTLRTGRPARIEFTREEEFSASRSRHPQLVRFRAGLDEELRLTALDMEILQNSGAYGPHSLTVMSVTAAKTLALYRAPNLRIEARSVYTNLPPAGAYRGYGAPQGFFALECLLDEIATELDVDPIELRHRNYVREGDEVPIARRLGEGREGFPVKIRSSGMSECLEEGRRLIGWDELRTRASEARAATKSRGRSSGEAAGDTSGPLRRGVGMALAAQGSGIAGIDMGAAFLKMNEDASFNLCIGATDLGTGSDTALAQIAAEVLEVPVERILVYSSDTDLTPFDAGAYASSTTYVSGTAVHKAATRVREQILDAGRRLLSSAGVRLEGGRVVAREGGSMSLEEICTQTFYTAEQEQIMAAASHMSFHSPPPFNATFAEVEVDTETGFVRVLRIVSVTDAGRVINPRMAEGQAEGAIPQSLGMALSEFMVFGEGGEVLNRDLERYHIYTAIDMPEVVVRFVQTEEPTGPFGAKAVAEIPINGPAPAVVNAVYNACGVRIRELPLTPEKVLRGLES